MEAAVATLVPRDGHVLVLDNGAYCKRMGKLATIPVVVQVVNKANEFVGIIFDGNIQSLVLDCIFSDKQARAVSVDSAAISEALKKVYDANPLADELEGKK